MLRWLPLILILVSSGSKAQGLIINEVMADPGESDADCEWVELFNPGSLSVDIKGWVFEGGIMSDTSLIVKGEGFLLLARQLLDDDGDSLSFESVWGNSSGVWGDDSLLEDYLALRISMVLRNEDGSLTIVSPEGGEETFCWDYTQEGKSWEKVDPRGGNGMENWKICQDLSTPGRRNSWTTPHYDAAVFAEEISFFPSHPSPGTGVEIQGIVHNLGDRQIPPSSLTVIFFEDADLDSIIDQGEGIGQAQPIDKAIPPGDSVGVSLWGGPFSSGSHLISIWLLYPPDEYTTNNLAGKFLQIPFAQASVVINEMMYDPWEGPEWVELLNIEGAEINLQGWRLGDKVGESSPISSPGATLKDGEYAIVTSDSLDFSSIYPQVSAPLWEVKAFPSLNNDADMVVLTDASGQTVDSLFYSHKWGGDKGISLERINPYLSSSDSANWSSCVLPNGSTPGRENSIYAPLLPIKGNLSIHPNPFSPDGDGRDDRALISYRLPVETALITIRVYDLQGRKVLTLTDQEPTGYKGEKIWDGRDDQGKRISIGFYILYLEALNSSRGVLVSLKKPLVVAGKL